MYAISDSGDSADSADIALQILDNVIMTRWNILPAKEREGRQHLCELANC
jgi:hypothetical protein